MVNKKSLSQNTALLLGFLGLLLWSSSFWIEYQNKTLMLTIGFLMMSIGVVGFSYSLYFTSIAGIRNNGVWFSSLVSRGIWGWLLGLVLTGFYVLLYFYPEFLGYNEAGKSSGLVAFFDPLSVLLNGKPATQWFLYGTAYTLAIILFGVKFIFKYRNNRYQVFRTISVIFFQLGFAFLIPEILSKLNQDLPYFSKDLKNMWPLNYYFFEDWHFNNMLNGGNLGLFILVFGLLMMFIISPILTYFFGKRWYCSWVCGCGGLAETAGDPFRQLSSKKISVWKFERWMIHVVLVFIFITTIAVIWTYLGSEISGEILTRKYFANVIIGFLILLILVILLWGRKELNKDAVNTIISIATILIFVIVWQSNWNQENLMFVDSYSLRKWYGFGVGAAFSGVLGVGFYPILGSRVWCRFGCPMAAILGLQQRLLSRFRITTNGGQCISCGNCSSYCEMGIDVRSYAQNEENIVRSSCVGCGICATVCPRGVLKLENVSSKNRY
jgi:polyferredoxin